MNTQGFIEKLLDGEQVVWKPVSEIFHLRNGYTPSKSNEEFWKEGTVPWFRLEDIRANGRVLVDSIQHVTASAVKGNLFPANSLIMSTTATLGEHALVTTPCLTNQQITNFSVVDGYKEILNIKYLHHCFFDFGKWCIDNANKSGGVGIIGINKLKQYQIPIPCPDNPEKSLAIQAEIVRILDKFTELTTELTTELNARKKQYNYYRDQLLSFEEGEVEWKPMGEIGEFIRGKRFTKKDFVADGGVNVIHYGEIYTHYGTSATNVISQVRADLAESLRYAEPNDVIVSSVSETIEDVGKAVAWLGEDKVAIHDDSYAIRHSLNPKYLSYCLQTENFTMQKVKHVSRGKVKRLLIDGVSKVKIPVPFPNDPKKSRIEQDRIVAILDKFDTLTNSISEGLPREIELRQKQYEYYRNLLLSFPKPEVTGDM